MFHMDRISRNIILLMMMMMMMMVMMVMVMMMVIVVFLSYPLVKKHADLSGSFLYSQSTMKDMYSKPTNRTELSIPMKTKSIAQPLYIYANRRTFGKRKQPECS